MPVRLQIPARASLVLALVGGVAQVVNYSVIAAGSRLHGAIALGLSLLIAANIPPLVGPAFRGALHLPAHVAYTITVLLAVVMLIVTQTPIGHSLHEILAIVVTVVQALGFSPAALNLPLEAPPARPGVTPVGRP